MPISLPICPCQINPVSDAIGAPLLYQDCCQPYHDGLLNNEADKIDGVKPDSAERLMRSRYRAFVLVKPDYIVKTTLPEQQNLLDIKAIENWATEKDLSGIE